MGRIGPMSGNHRYRDGPRKRKTPASMGLRWPGLLREGGAYREFKNSSSAARSVTESAL